MIKNLFGGILGQKNVEEKKEFANEAIDEDLNL